MHNNGYSNLRKGRASISGQIYHIVSRTYERQPIFNNWNTASAACAAFTSPVALKDSSLLCWVLMPDHVHWLLELNEDDELSAVIKRMKSVSANAVRNCSSYKDKVWYRGFYDRAIRQEDDLIDVARYIVANPLRAGICKSIRQYPFWNAVYF